MKLGAFYCFAYMGPWLCAGPVVIGQYDFGPDVTTIDFAGMVPGAPVGGFYAGFGVTFGPGVYMSEFPGQITNQLGLLPELPVQIGFAVPIPLVNVGFEVRGSDGDVLTLSVLDSQGNPAGSLDYLIGSTFQFVGVNNPGLGGLVIDDLSFGGGQIFLQNLQIEAVPEPGTKWMFGSVAAIFVVARRKRKQI